MKYLLALLSIFGLSQFSTGQEYLDMMNNPQVNFYDVVEAAEAYFAEHGKGKGSGYKPFMRWVVENESHYYPSGDRSQVDPYFVTNAYKAYIEKYGNVAYK
ncbi:MAG: hypothetical protein KDC92_15735, partial [Bacteroidetes bacterium]|nr:hypothetical protein [Bacteroidota bacterium]